MTARFAVDTSVAIPLLVASHQAHRAVRAWAEGRTLSLCGHALVETYSVLTRLPGDARVLPADAVELIDDNFVEHGALAPEVDGQVHRLFAPLDIAGGATYDGLVALAARQHDTILVTRDARGRGTYEALGVRVHVIAEAIQHGANG